MKKIIHFFAGIFYRPVLLKYLSSTRSYRYKGVSLLVPPEVFHPAFFFSTKLLLKYLDDQPLQGRSLLELGAGSGLISIYAAKKGALVTASDINPIAVRNLEVNRKRNNDVPLEIILSDLFADIPARRFDYIAINPPYFKKKPATPKEYAWYCGEQGEYFDNLFSTIGPYLHEQSRVLMILSEVCDLDMIHRYAEKHGWMLQLVLTHKNILEKMLLYELLPRQEKARQASPNNEEHIPQ